MIWWHGFRQYFDSYPFLVPIYSAEVAPPHIRGAMLANWQLADSLGTP